MTPARQARRSNPAGLRSLGPLALAVALMVGAVVVLGQAAQARGAGGAAQAHSQQRAVAAALARLQRADVHVETPYQGKDLEFNVSLTQTENDCQAAFSNGAYCLRYALIIDEAPVLAGYGMVPSSDVHITNGNIVIHIDVSKVPGFVVVLGKAQVVSINWKQTLAQTVLRTPMSASAQGALGAYQIPTSGPSGTVIAHILMS